MKFDKFILFRYPRPRCEFRIPSCVWSGCVFPIIPVLLAACSASAPTPLPTSIAAGAPTLAPTATHKPVGTLINEPGQFEGYTLLAVNRSGAVYLIDNRGRVVHAWTVEHGDSHLLVQLLNNGDLLTGGNKIVDPNGNVVWEYSYYQHHDLLKMPNGNVLILSRLIIPRKDAVALGANPDALACPLLGSARIVEVRPTGPADGEIVWQWSAIDHIIQDYDPGKPNYGIVANHPELVDINFALDQKKCAGGGRIGSLNANALDYNAELDQIMITARHFSEIWIIDHSTSVEEAAGHAGGNGGKGGDLLYRWGNPRAYQRGAAEDRRLFEPHNAHWIPEGLPGAGNVLIFNNGTDEERAYSTVDEIALSADGYSYRLDPGSAYRTDEVVWSYAAAPPRSFYAPVRSGAQRLPNGNTLIADGPSNRIFEVTREGKTVWEFTHPVESREELREGLYRALRYAPDHPGIRALERRLTNRPAPPTGAPIAHSVFDIHVTDENLVYAKGTCSVADMEHRFFLHVVPERANDLPEEHSRRGYDSARFDFFPHGAVFDGKCLSRVPLPDYPVAAVRTGQLAPDGGELWSARFWLNPEPYRAAYQAAATGEPAARSVFDLYATDSDLVYVKETCDQGDTEARFYLHIIPNRADDLPEERRPHGFDNLDFDFFLRGAAFDGTCVATVPLPEYSIASVRTGQFVRSGDEAWSAEFALGGRNSSP